MFRLTAAVLLFLEMVIAPAVMLYENKQQRKRAEDLDVREYRVELERKHLRRWGADLVQKSAELKTNRSELVELERKLAQQRLSHTYDQLDGSHPEQPLRNLIDFDAREMIIPQRWTSEISGRPRTITTHEMEAIDVRSSR